jgi:hypothetical protein
MAFGQANFKAVEAVLGTEKGAHGFEPVRAALGRRFRSVRPEDQRRETGSPIRGLGRGDRRRALQDARRSRHLRNHESGHGLGRTAPRIQVSSRSNRSSTFLSYYFYQAPKTKANDYLIAALKKQNKVPDLFDPDGFVAAQMIVRAIEKSDGANVDQMIAGLDGWTFDAPKGTETVRADDHAMLQPMYIAKLSGAEPQLIRTLDASGRRAAGFGLQVARDRGAAGAGSSGPRTAHRRRFDRRGRIVRRRDRASFSSSSVPTGPGRRPCSTCCRASRARRGPHHARGSRHHARAALRSRAARPRPHVPDLDGLRRLSTLENVRLAASAALGTSAKPGIWRTAKRPARARAPRWPTSGWAAASAPAALLSHGEKRKLDLAILLCTEPASCCWTNRRPAWRSKTCPTWCKLIASDPSRAGQDRPDGRAPDGSGAEPRGSHGGHAPRRAARNRYARTDRGRTKPCSRRTSAIRCERGERSCS